MHIQIFPDAQVGVQKTEDAITQAITRTGGPTVWNEEKRGKKIHFKKAQKASLCVEDHCIVAKIL